MKALKKEIVDLTRLADSRSYTVASEGNISYRLSEDRFLITPTRKIKAFLKERDLVIIDSKGNKIKGKEEASSERFTHLAIYKERPDIRCIVHTHPFYTLLLSSAKITPGENPLLSESAMFVQNVRLLPFARPSTSEGAQQVKEACHHTNILIIERHGCFTYAKDLFTAFSLLELLEKTARFEYEVRKSGFNINPLNENQLESLKKVSY